MDDLRPIPAEVKAKIGSLLSTKKMNPANFFSFSFKLGVYMPILAPFMIPIFLTIVLVLRNKLFTLLCKRK